MSTDKSLKHLKSIDKFLKVIFQTILRNIHSGTAHHKSNSLTVQSTGVSRRTVLGVPTSRNLYTFVAATFETGTIQTCGRL